jgi:hypothetical protein
MTHCTNCGIQNTDSAKFCKECGETINSQEPEKSFLEKKKSPRKFVKAFLLSISAIIAAIVLMLIVNLYSNYRKNLPIEIPVERLSSLEIKEQKALDQMQQSPQDSLEQTGQQPQWISTGLTGKHITSASLRFYGNNAVYVRPSSGDLYQQMISITFDKDGANLLREITKRNIDKEVAIFLDGRLISSPVVREEIMDGRVVIPSYDENGDDLIKVLTN